MRNVILRIREADRAIFNQLQENIKTVETRAATTKYKNIQVSDVLTFACGKDKLTKTITAVSHYPSIEAMYKDIQIPSVLPGITTLAEAQKIHYGFTGYKAKIEKCGILAFQLSS